MRGRRTAYLVDRKSEAGDREHLILALAALVHRAGTVTISNAEFDAINARQGLRARYEPDGSMTLWTYDLLEDIKGLVRGSPPGKD